MAKIDREPVHVTVPKASRSDLSTYRFWRQRGTMMIDIQIFNFDAGSYLRMMPKKAPTKLEKNKKKKYLQAFL